MEEDDDLSDATLANSIKILSTFSLHKIINYKGDDDLSTTVNLTILTIVF
jgi:hypothetical protein